MGLGNRRTSDNAQELTEVSCRKDCGEGLQKYEIYITNCYYIGQLHRISDKNFRKPETYRFRICIPDELLLNLAN